MTIENIKVVVAALFIIALSAERFIEMAKPWIEKIKEEYQSTVKIAGAVLIGVGLSALFRFDMLAELTITGTPPIAGYVAAGLVSSVGSSTLHSFLEWLKTLQSPKTVVKTVTETTSTAPIPATVTTTTTPPQE